MAPILKARLLTTGVATSATIRATIRAAATTPMSESSIFIGILKKLLYRGRKPTFL